jgi:ligand-binding SRPBCC domain-containing protein
MNFRIKTDLKNKSIHPGMLIRYTVSPLANIPLKWVTEITDVKHHEYFIDEQRIGPYSHWHHKHHFLPLGDQVIMTDELQYALPLGILGQWMNKIMIDHRIDQIFEYREGIIKDLFRKSLFH